jgi:hypothetical protein
VPLKSLEIRHFQVFVYLEEPGLTPPGPPQSFGIGKTKETAPMEAVGSTLALGQEAKKEIVVIVFAPQYCPARGPGRPFGGGWQGERY